MERAINEHVSLPLMINPFEQTPAEKEEDIRTAVSKGAKLISYQETQ